LRAAGAAAAGKGISWTENVDSAFAAAKSQGKLLMVDLYTDWCSWCKELDKRTYPDPAVIGLASDFIALKTNPEKDPRGADLERKYAVQGYPAILFLEPDGTLVNRIEGFLEAAPFAKRMRTTLDYRPKIKAYGAEFKAGELRNAESLVAMLVELSRAAEAGPVYDKIAAKLAAPARAGYALAIGKALVDSKDYRGSLAYLKAAELPDPKGEGAREARLYRSISAYYVEGKDAALAYLNGLLAASPPPEWKARYQDIKDQILKAR
jgi:thiol-disulfide isomerase/thioredoxin